MRYKDLSGMRFGRLLVMKDVGRKNHTALWLCKCDCGNDFVSIGYPLGKSTFSCGCLQRDKLLKNITKHGKCHTRIYKIWSEMKRRCNASTCKAYVHYGGRGIKVCKEWNDGFETFYKWAMGNGYKDNLTLERKDVNKGYYPENCTWITKSEQTNNMTTTHFVVYNGEKMTLSQLSRKVGISRATICKYEKIFNYDYDLLVKETLVNPHHLKEVKNRKGK